MAVGLWAILAQANASTLTIDTVNGTFASAVTTNAATGKLTGLGTSTIAWGTPWKKKDHRSSYAFAGGAPITQTTAGSFLLGSYTHSNGTIATVSDSLLSTVLNVNVAGTADGQAFSLMSSFLLNHNETVNASACPAGTNPCGDLVTIASLVGGSSVITVGQTIFTLIIDGFVSTLGGPIVTSFLTAENAQQTLYLQGSLQIATVPLPPVPLPAAGIAMIGALGALAMVRRKRNPKA